MHQIPFNSQTKYNNNHQNSLNSYSNDNNNYVESMLWSNQRNFMSPRDTTFQTPSPAPSFRKRGESYMAPNHHSESIGQDNILNFSMMQSPFSPNSNNHLHNNNNNNNNTMHNNDHNINSNRKRYNDSTNDNNNNNNLDQPSLRRRRSNSKRSNSLIYMEEKNQLPPTHSLYDNDDDNYEQNNELLLQNNRTPMNSNNNNNNNNNNNIRNISSSPYFSTPSRSLMTPRGFTKSQKDSGSWEKWIVVFGFPPNMVSQVLRKFQDYGQILEHKEDCNWIIIMYATELQAQKALCQNTCNLPNTTIILAVQPLTPQLLNQLDISIDTLGEIKKVSNIPISTPMSAQRIVRKYNQRNMLIDDSHLLKTPKKKENICTKILDFFLNW